MSGKPKTRAEKINRLRELLPTLTPEELAKLVPHQTFIDLAVSLGIQNPNQYGTTVNIIHAINNVLTGQKWVGEKPPELKIDETEGREISQSKRSRTRQDILVFDNPEARAALFEQYPPEWEQQRRALNAQMGSVAEFPLAAVLPAPTPALAVQAPPPVRTRNAPSRRTASTFEERGGYANPHPVVNVVEEKVPEIMFAEPTSTKKRKKPISANEPITPSVFLPAAAIDFGPPPVPLPPLPKNLTELLTALQSDLMKPLGITALHYALIRLLFDIQGTSQHLAELPGKINQHIRELTAKLDKVKTYAAEMKRQDKPLPPSVSEMGTFYSKSYLPQLIKYRRILEILYTHPQRERMKEFLWNVARSRVTADCLVYLMNIYGALANAADWQYKAFANPAQLTPENVKLVQDKIQKAKQEIVSQTQKFQLSACYTRVPNFAE